MERQQGKGGPPPASAPFVHPGVNPDVKRHTAEILARRGAGGTALPKVQMPVAGGPAPAIPRLDGAPQIGYTMEEVARQQRGEGQMAPGSSIVEQPAVGPAARNQKLLLTPADILPREAAQDPEFQQGTGSMVAMSQPNLAAKYGVHRNGKFIPPQQLVPQGQAQLRPETLRDLQQLEALKSQQAGSPAIGALTDDEREVERAVAAGPAGAAARIGNAPGDDSNRPLSEEEKAKLKTKLEGMDEFEFDSFRQSMMKDILNNPEQQKIIEERLQPLDITDMIVNGYVTQLVPIIPGKLSFTFRSLSGETETEIKRMIMEETKSLEVSDRYLLDRYAFMSVAAGLLEINGKPLGDVYDKSSGDFSEDLFRKKLNRILKLPLHMLASIGVNQMWFEQRARKLYVAEKVGNG